jgi:hypothetical protein
MGVLEFAVLPRARLLLLTNCEPFADPSAKKFLALPESSCEIALICLNSVYRFAENVDVVPVAV